VERSTGVGQVDAGEKQLTMCLCRGASDGRVVTTGLPQQTGLRKFVRRERTND
jgi:hypothetical protein